MTSSENTSRVSAPCVDTDSRLGERTGRSLLWNGLETFGMAAVQLAISIVLARLVAPEAFGMIAMLQVFMAVGMIFADTGVSQALIRLPHRSRALESAALVICLTAATVYYTALWLAAPLIAGFYSQPEMAGLVRIMALGVPLFAACVVPAARLSTQMRFGRQAAISVISLSAGGAAGIVAAIHGAGVMALVWQQLTTMAARTLMLWAASPLCVSLRIRMSDTRMLAGYSWKLMLSSLIDTLYTNMYAPLLGRLFNADITAMYWRADSLARFAPQGLAGALARVSLPALSLIRDDKTRTLSAYTRLISCTGWLIFPVCAIAAAVAEPLFSLLLTDRWLPAVPLFRILCASLALYPLHAINCTALNVFGRSDKFLILEVLKKCVGVAALCVSLPMGVTALCYGILCSSLLCLALNVGFASRYIGLGLVAQLRIMLPSLAAAMFGAAAAFGTTQLFEPVWQQTVFGTSAGIVVYLAASYISGITAPQYIKEVLQHHSRSREQCI